ncbi:MAG: magnesium transporter CorA family protein [Spirochaetes bacterium]|uniref:Magnesium transporter CorA family protein n=1 Tax=Candidatus Ornithospirochaeta stercoripullorum TaxID=2840899 RepID=A0A9D9H5I9_9SPIO|nr:magnesium transporter CorA family protein [Candidatus Ornithospirochaeta stercoripullorum]
MITKRTDLTVNQNYTWIDCREIDKEDISILTDEYMISSELLADIMDADEQSRIEKEDDYTVIICRLPSAEEDDEKPLERTTITLGMVLYPDRIITICRGDSVVIDDFARHRFRQCPVETKEGFVISILGRAALVYIRFLKYINRQKDLVEEQLHQSIMNYELIQLLQIQKSLVYLTTGLTDNEVLLEKLQKTPYFHLNTEDEEEFLEDSITDNKQAIAMANIYSDILTGTMDAFASVIGNNMNVIMKRLTIISLSLMFPTFITGFFGMNVSIPGMDGKWAWLFLLGLCALVAIIGTFIISDRKNRSVIKAGLGEKRSIKKKKESQSPSEIKYLRRKKHTLENDD